jgi:predicted ATPase
MLNTLAVANYRSLRKLVVPLRRLNVVTGPNGSGKSSLYRALRLLGETAQGGLVASLAREGGLQSTLWAGAEQISRAMRSGQVPVQGTVRREPVHLRLGFGAADLSYAIDLGLPTPSSPMFALDPEIKRECIWVGPVFRRSTMLVDRHGPVIGVKGIKEEWGALPGGISSFESMMTEFSDPRVAPEMLAVRDRVRSWRFYDHFRTDAAAPARQPQVGTHTPVLADDGADLAAALEDAFPGARIDVGGSAGWLELAMHQHGLLRPLRGGELSDGTLRYLLLVAALLTPRPPELLVLNEPETSLHADLVPALARLITSAAERSQVIVVTHNARLIAALGEVDDAFSIRLEKVLGETSVADLGLHDQPRWEWPAR